MDYRNFKLDTQWNMIHYPYKPNGFGILILGDERHFVEEKNSFWMQNEGKRMLLENWRQCGYTIFYSNLYGLNWGSDKAVDLAKGLLAHVKRNEILNGKIHVVAEGMGALTALKLISSGMDIRSLLLINPILSLGQHLQQEKEHKFFYKKLIKELSLSYQVDRGQVEAMFEDQGSMPEFSKDIPVRIIHILAGSRGYRQSKLLNEYSIIWEKEKLPISVCYMVPEKKPHIGPLAIQFFRKHEQIL
ncbi:hydrolase [Mesobacillus campisalis]|uniref:Hydrolase n=1 Tax=Mesobacillus campisalis TaxID=1408103 RepID=A0A0M2STB8_9BACI|nr:hypothetical protein [Mesobacillus campisalis]KKK36951.1 hydrolase [Mesobacillus campisalis]